MELNLDIICDHLPKTLKIQRFGPICRNLCLNLPILYENGCEFEEGRLYVTNGDRLPKRPPKKGLAVVCVDQRPPQEWVDNNCQILLISNSPSLFFVFNKINKIYEKFNVWDSKLRDELEAEDDFDIKKLLKTGTMILENPILVANSTMLAIFGTELVSAKDSADFDVVESSNYKPVPSEMIKDACRLERVIKEPYISSVATDGKKSYCSNLYQSGYFAGCISVTEANRPFKYSDFPLANHFFAYFQKAFAKYLKQIPPIELPGTAALKDLLNGIPLSTQEQDELVLGEEECWMCFKMKNTQTINYLPIEYMCTTITTLMPGRIYAVINEDEILGLLKLHSKENAATQKTLKLFEEVLDKMGYIAGLSNEFFSINQTGIYMKQADYAVEVGSQTDSNSHVFYFGELILQYMLTRFNGEFPVECLFSKGLISLIEHDKHSNTDYIQTLDIYLKNEMSITQTSNELFLHRSSLLSRLDKIRKLLDADLDDPDVRLYIRICLYLLTSGI